jgi:ParB family chromosome partitioning protein
MSPSPQKQYLEGILGPEDSPENEEQQDAAQRSHAPLSSALLTRANSLERIATGGLKQVAQVRLDPKKCRIWHGNGRNYAVLNYDRCKDLIDSIIAEGGQKVPALVRKLKNVPDYDYEVIYGTRRHWAISWLRNNNYPEFMFLAEVREVDDEAAFRLADLENRARDDITEFERARNYAAALPLYYDGVQSKMAERLKISRSWLSKMIAFAGVSDKIIGAFTTPEQLTLTQGYVLAQAVSNPAAEARAANAAEAIAKENTTLIEAGRAALPTASILKSLLTAASGERPVKADRRQVLYKGKPIVTVLDENRNGVRVQIHSGTGANLEAIIESLREALQESELEPVK